MDISVVLNQMLVLFIVLIIGYTANKLNILNGTANVYITKTLLNITVPGMIFYSFVSTEIALGAYEIFLCVAISGGASVLFWAAAFPLSRVFGIREVDRGIYAFMLVFGNVAFMGFPVLTSILGADAAIYLAFFNIPFNLLSYSLGIALVSHKNGGRRFSFKLWLNTPMVVSVISLAVFLLKIDIPKPLFDSARLLNNATTPIAMILIGSTLAEIPLKKVFNDWRVYPYSLLKLIAEPLIIWLILRNIIADQMILAVAVLLCAMPVATNATLLSMEYGGNEELASKSVFISTALSVATIPLVVFLLFT